MSEQSRRESTTRLVRNLAVAASIIRNQRIPLLVVVVSFIFSGACGMHRLSSSTSRPWQLRGRVLSMTADSLNVRHKSGQVVGLSIDDRTEYFVNRKPDSKESVHVGTRLTVLVETTPEHENRARRIDVFR